MCRIAGIIRGKKLNEKCNFRIFDISSHSVFIHRLVWKITSNVTTNQSLIQFCKCDMYWKYWWFAGNFFFLVCWILLCSEINSCHKSYKNNHWCTVSMHTQWLDRFYENAIVKRQKDAWNNSRLSRHDVFV